MTAPTTPAARLAAILARPTYRKHVITTAQSADMRRRYAAGEGLAALGRRYGINPRTVRYHLDRPDSWEDRSRRDALIAMLWQRGDTLDQIADVVGLTRNAVWNATRRLDLPRRNLRPQGAA